jgi:hypothetical protein
MPPLPAEKRAALRASILEHQAILVPVVEDEFGDVIDGHHRCVIWHELRAEGHKIADYPRYIRVGLTDAEKRTLARQLYLARPGMRHRGGVANRPEKG